MFHKLIESFKEDKLINTSKVIIYLSLIFIIFLDIFVMFGYTLSKRLFLTTIFILFAAIYFSLLPLCIESMKYKIIKIIYSILYSLAIFLIILLINQRLEFFNFIFIFIMLLIVIMTIVKIRKNEYTKEILNRFTLLYCVFIFSSAIMITSICDALLISKLLFIVNIILILIYFNVKDIIINFICIIFDKLSNIIIGHYYNKHPEQLKKDQAFEEHYIKIMKEKEEYLNSIPNYAIIPKSLYVYDDIIKTTQKSLKHSGNDVTFELEYDTGLIFKNIAYHKFTQKRNFNLYIGAIFEISKEELCKICSKEWAILKNGRASIKVGNYKNMPTIYSKNDIFSDNFVSGYLSFYHNVKISLEDKKNKGKEPGVYCLEDKGMVISNKDRDKFYVAYLIEEKPEKTETYVEYMKKLNPDLEKYIDIFGNEIDFREEI